MKGKLNEVGFTFHLPEPCGGWRQFIIRASKLHGKLTWSWTVSGNEGADDVLPVELLDAIQEALTWASPRVNETDVFEHDRDDGCTD